MTVHMYYLYMTNTHHFVDGITPDLARCWLLVLQRDVIEATTDQVKAINLK